MLCDDKTRLLDAYVAAVDFHGVTVTSWRGDHVADWIGSRSAGDHRGRDAEDDGSPLRSGFGQVSRRAVEHDCRDRSGGSGSILE